MANTSAIASVFALPELLEQILLCLPERTLLQAIAGSRSWAHQIKSSPQIQRKLSLQPHAKLFAYTLTNRRNLVPEVLVNAFLFDPHELQIDNPVPPEQLVDASPCYFDVASYFRSQTIDEQASCRRTLLSEPPLTSIELWMDYRAPGWLEAPRGARNEALEDWYQSHEDLENAEGVRIGDILDVMDEFEVAGNAESFCVEMSLDVDDAEAEEILREGQEKELGEVEATHKRLLKLNATVSIARNNYQRNFGVG